ncbi:calponin homology domain-containing protein DDB_G0272472 [Stomoxys calcitrans]|uniref:calponin homology domain-containing protein DDB_G0272472 n=1 Tax=Stomoxys calcitrans TaxID=35570 RepID=UPI0027E36C89|nr:calponin homology domain-containing protein DDB_G0272472 [Stomoxys calcitrans]
MRHPLKLVPPRWWAIILWLSLVPASVFTLPTIESSNALRARLLQHVERSYFQPPALEETIHEVQQILNGDPSLPRLTRGEIEELYEKVTREEYHKSMEAGDKIRADNMRALMLVLPYNTDNNTEENLQELFTRPPVTKVVDSYTSHQPIQFLTPSGHNEGKFENVAVGPVDATTYKPSFMMKPPAMAPNPTTYHPSNPPPVLYRMTPSLNNDHLANFKPLVTDLPFNHAYGPQDFSNQTPKPGHRFSSHYSAKDVEFLKQALEKRKRPTIKPVADVLESMGIVSQTQTRNRGGASYDEYYAAESAPVPQVVSVADLKGLRPQSLAPQIKPDAYSMFKPLNIGEEIRVKPEVEGYLTRFGIVGGRKRKAIKKNEASSTTQNALEQLGEGSEIATAKIPSGSLKAKKSAASGSRADELNKLLENLRELERLNLSPKIVATTPRPRPTTTTTTTTTSTTTTTTTTTPKPPTTPALITNGDPLLIEPKKPRRRIDPNFDINFGSQGNQETAAQSDELSKLLKNLQELENLNVKPQNALKPVSSVNRGGNAAASRPVGVVTPAPPTIESQTLGNRFSQSGLTPQQHLLQLQQQVGRGSTQPDLQQLQLVLQQLQAYEKANAKTSKKPTTTTTSRPSSPLAGLTPQQHLLLLQQQAARGQTQPDLQQLQQVLQELQAYEQVSVRTTQRPTTTTTTPRTTTSRRPAVNVNAQLGPTDMWQLRQLLTDDSQLEKLFEQAKARQKPKATTTTTSTTSRPAPTLTDLVELQKYFAELDRAAVKTTSTTTPAPTTTTSTTTTTTTTTPPPPPPTTTTTTTTTSTTTTTPRPYTTHAPPPLSSIDYEPRPKKQSADQAQLEELINRVQQLERLNSRPANLPSPLATDTPLSPLLGFTTRNVKAPTKDDYRLPVNDFANLRNLYNQVGNGDRGQYGDIEISTKATAAKAYEEQLYESTTRRSQNFAQRIIDITNDTGSGSSLREVDANEFVQLQKLLSKVQELERVRIALPTPNPNPKTKNEREATQSPALQSAASQRSQNVQKLNGAHIVYPNKEEYYAASEKDIHTPKELNFKKVEDLIMKEAENLRLDLPTYKQTLEKPFVNKQQPEQTSSEELREIVYAKPYVESSTYKDLQPPMIHKTVTKEPPRFVAKTSSEVNKVKHEKSDLEELQKLLNNAQELKKLGITLPKELTEKLETKLDLNGLKDVEQTQPEEISKEKYFQDRERPVFRPTTESPEENEPSEKTAVFSLTTMKSLTPREPKTTTESSVELPVFSATKIIEAAIKRAANKIGVSTEFPQGFQRRSDEQVEDLQFDDGDDMTAAFSEFNYQMVLPEREDSEGEFSEMNYQTALPENTSEADMSSTENPAKDLGELQRLIKNLEELQKLNISNNPELLRKADAQYLESLKKTQSPEDDKLKARRQSAETTEATTAASSGKSSTENPTRVQLNLNLDEVMESSSIKTSTEASSSSSTSTTTEESRNGSLADLEDSFGPDPNTEAPPPPKKKNGFYFLADWNSFLEVGDGDDQVVVRLSPKIGDPRLFLPVKIP